MNIGIINTTTFLIATTIFIITPGIDTIFVLNKTITEGTKAGTLASLGINAGVLIHTLLAALGLSLIISESTLAFNAIKYAGATYLIVMGLAKVFSKGKAQNTAKMPKQKHTSNDFFSGMITNALNPKVALFFLAFFPQFIAPDQISSPFPFIVLGLTYALMGVVWYLAITAFANRFSQKLMHNAKAYKYLNNASGVIFIFMGIQVAAAS